MRTLGNFGGAPHLYMSGSIDCGLVYIDAAPDALWIGTTAFWRVTPLVFGYFYLRLAAAEDKLTDYRAFAATAQRWQAIWDYCRPHINFAEALRSARGVGRLPHPPRDALNDNLIPHRELDAMLARAKASWQPASPPPSEPFARRQHYLARGKDAEKKALENEKHARKLAYLRRMDARHYENEEDKMPF